jgi:hypothetical protein
MPLQPVIDPDWYMIVDQDDRKLYGYLDTEMYDESNTMIPLPDMKHWLEPIFMDHDKKELTVMMYEYPEKEHPQRVTVCRACGVLVEAASSKKHKLCPDCITFGVIAKET